MQRYRHATQRNDRADYERKWQEHVCRRIPKVLAKKDD
ncbi:signal transduction histidine kinase domain protein [Vibrio parahaemolyticus V-223/04]|nr:signal transduction histidine kinase domain protein [Vibrio parahaemolyticus V-223/04]